MSDYYQFQIVRFHSHIQLWRKVITMVIFDQMKSPTDLNTVFEIIGPLQIVLAEQSPELDGEMA